MAQLTPLGIVVDRATAVCMNARFDELGGAWAEVFRVWQRTDMRYLVLLAHTKKRLRLRAPLTWMARDDAALQAALLAARANLSDTKCRWVILMEEGSDGIALVRKQLLMVSHMEARA